jgi:hypothetical protein
MKIVYNKTAFEALPWVLIENQHQAETVDCLNHEGSLNEKQAVT